MKDGSPIAIETNDGRRVGVFRKNTYVSYRKKSVHLFKKIGDNGSWGIDYNILFNSLPETAAVRIIEKEENVIYQTPVKVFRAYGTVLHFKEGTKDHNVQVFLPIHYWNRIKLR